MNLLNLSTTCATRLLTLYATCHCLPPGPVFCLLLSSAQLRLCSPNHKAGYYSNLACDWLSIVWAYSVHETENGSRFVASGDKGTLLIELFIFCIIVKQPAHHKCYREAEFIFRNLTGFWKWTNHLGKLPCFTKSELTFGTNLSQLIVLVSTPPCKLFHISSLRKPCCKENVSPVTEMV